jgi:zinc transport system permease protein
MPGLIGGLWVALVAGPLGCFIVWRRMVFFGAAISHSALLGVALGVVLGINLTAGVVLVSGAAAALLVALRRDKRLADDTILGIIAHAALALGLIAVTFLDGPQVNLEVDLEGVLFGDIRAIGSSDLIWIFAGGAAGLAILIAIWKPLLSMTVHEELAAVEGVPVAAVRLVFMLTLAVVVGIALKVVGALLIISLLIIPAAAARRIAIGPEWMAVAAALIGMASVLGGLQAHVAWEVPAGPAVVVMATLLFLASVPTPRLLMRPRRNRS